MPSYIVRIVVDLILRPLHVEAHRKSNNSERLLASALAKFDQLQLDADFGFVLRFAGENWTPQRLGVLQKTIAGIGRSSRSVGWFGGVLGSFEATRALNYLLGLELLLLTRFRTGSREHDVLYACHGTLVRRLAHYREETGADPRLLVSGIDQSVRGLRMILEQRHSIVPRSIDP